MKLLIEYLSTKIKPSRIFAQTQNIEYIVRDEIARLGKNADLNHIDTSDVTDMSLLFDGKHFNGDISKWDVSNVKNMDRMFGDCEDFDCDLNNWDVSNVTDMYCMFLWLLCIQSRFE